MAAVATARQGNQRLDGFAVQPAAVPAGLHLRHISADQPHAHRRKGPEKMTMTMKKKM
ncbi:uncharacterized protein TrAtP1_006701 [Trichoderma atroviride]|uniref:uncharacterized protein n=1 Tax=Hypocrea atroviridis TaxID=63577 RepID=UPI00332C6AA8|nr:hypothetical protein TrAtP1_006701 [Trichoderma atroviride]